MKFGFQRELANELADFEANFRRRLSTWWEQLLPYTERLKDDMTWNVLPSMVLAVYRYLGLKPRLALDMANVFKTVYLGNRIYESVGDENEGQVHDQKLQFSILIADYLLGHVLKQLVDAQTDWLLDRFAGMIIDINEGLILKHKLHTPLEQALMKYEASLYGTAFLTAAELAGVDESTRILYRDMGLNCGMALGMIQTNSANSEIEPYIDRCETNFYAINKGFSPRSSILEKAIKEIHHYACRVEKAALV